MPSSREITWHPPFYMGLIDYNFYLSPKCFILHFFTISCININKENIPPTTERAVRMGYSLFYVFQIE